MSECRYKIRNWAKYQHYKDRNPPWIKLHVEILSSEDWVSLDDASKLLAVACMIIASKHDGGVPDNPDYIQRIAYLKKRPVLKPLIECGFLELVADDSMMLADARPEKEAETQVRAEKESIPRASRFDDFWKLCPRKVGKGDARKAYIKAILKTAPALIEEAMNRYARARVGEPEQYTVHPATWLNAERWLDEAPSVAGNGHLVLVNPCNSEEEQALQQKMREEAYGVQ